MAYFKHYYSHDGFFTASQIIEDAYVSVTLLDFDIDFQGQTVSDVWAFGSFSNAEYINYYIGIDDLELDGDVITAGTLQAFAVTLDDAEQDMDEEDYEETLMYATGINLSFSQGWYDSFTDPSHMSDFTFTALVLSSDDEIRMSNQDDTAYGFDGDDAIYGYAGDDKIYGGAGKDYLNGGVGADILRGEGGNDRLLGGRGIDTLLGGAGSDRFVFQSTNDSGAGYADSDIIKDFKSGRDKIDLRVIDASDILNGNNRFTFDGKTEFGQSNKGDIYFKKFNLAGKSNDYTMVYIDTDADSDAEMTIVLQGLVNLTARDFLL